MKTHAQNTTQGQAALPTDKVLTKAETRIACGYVAGMIGKEIADACGVSYNTVVRHTQNIYEKTGIRRSTNALVAWFLSKNYDIDLGDFRRRVGAFFLLVIVSVQTVCVWTLTTAPSGGFLREGLRRGREPGRRAAGRMTSIQPIYSLFNTDFL